MKDLVLYVAKQLANHPDQVVATESEENGQILVKLTAAEDDKGKIIGREGKVIKAIRALAQAAASKQNKKAVVEVE